MPTACSGPQRGRPVRLGIHSFVWSATTTDTILDLLPGIAALGYDGVEVPVLTPGQLDTARLRAALSDAGLACTTSSAVPPHLSLIDASTRPATVDWLERVVEDAVALGSAVVCGPLLAPIGEMRGRGRTEAEWANGVAGLQELGDRIVDSGVTVALEPLNRFESYVVNTIADGVQLMQEVDRPSIGLLLDTFHMNIEEAAIPAAIGAARGHIAHVHLSENNRGSVGSGHVPWDAVLDALFVTGFDGWMVVESFGSALPELAAAASIWRPVAESADALAAESMTFIADRLAGRAEAGGIPGPR